MKTKHTPTPWTAHGNIISRDADGAEYPIAYTWDKLPMDNAAYIVLACNSHTDLLEMLKQSQRWIGKLIADRPEHDDTGIAARAQRQYDHNDEVIAKATGDQHGADSDN